MDSHREESTMGKPVSINPLKTSPGLGAAAAIQGFRQAFPLFHAGPGCTFLSKVVLTGHMREPVALLGTDIKEMSTIFGGIELLETRIQEVIDKQNPSILAVISTSLSDVRGEDVEGAVNSIRQSGNKNVIHIPAPDFRGGYAEGFTKAIEIVVRSFANNGPTIPGRLNIFPAPFMTAADMEEILEIVSSFGFTGVAIPDKSISVDGSKDSFSAASLEGTELEDVELSGRAEASISFGMHNTIAGDYLQETFDVPHFKLEGVTGLEATDRLISVLMKISGRDPSPFIKRQRKRLVDAMVDTHLFLFGKRAAIGLDTDHLISFKSFLDEIGIDSPYLRCGTAPSGKEAYPFEIESGDLDDLELLMIEGMKKGEPVNLLIANSHGQEIARRTGVIHYRTGFPIFDRFGEELKSRAGYRGTMNLLFEIANRFMENDSTHAHSGELRNDSHVDEFMYHHMGDTRGPAAHGC